MPKRLDRIFVVLVFLLSMGAVVDVYLAARGVDTYSAEGDRLSQVMWAVVYLMMLPGVFVFSKRIYDVAKLDRWLLALTALAIISVTWSALPGLTFRRSAALLATTLFGAYVAARYTIAEQLRMLAWALGVAAILSLLCALLVPQFGIGDDRFWRGVFTHKNSLGRLMALSTIVFFTLAKGARERRALKWLMGALSVALLALSGSSTGIVIAVGLFLTVSVIAWVQRSPQKRLVPGLILVTFLGAFALLSGTMLLGPFMELLGKDDTLTGRTFVWASAMDAIANRPLLGYGYSAFWPSAEGERIQSLLGPVFVHAHNGYLDLALQLGALGLVAFVFTLARNLWRALTTRVAEFEQIWPTIFFVFLLMYNMTESSILGRNNLFWILYVSTTLAILKEKRLNANKAREDDAARVIYTPDYTATET